MKHITLIAILTAGLSLTACANRQPPMETVWNATPDATISKDQALAKCRYDIIQPDTLAMNFDHLFLYSGQPLETATGHIQGLNPNGIARFRRCMATHGYQPGGMVQVPGIAP